MQMQPSQVRESTTRKMPRDRRRIVLGGMAGAVLLAAGRGASAASADGNSKDGSKKGAGDGGGDAAAGTGKPVFVLNGPNMDLLGKRQPELYGHETLDDVRRLCETTAARHGLSVDFRQSNSEGAIIDDIHAAREHGVAIIINPAAYAHTSIAIQDALHACDDMPIIEVHMTNTWTREAYRHTDYTAQVATAQINGCGVNGYVLAIEQVDYLLQHPPSHKGGGK